MTPAGTTSRGHSPIEGFRDGMVERWNSTSQIMEWPGTVNSAVSLKSLKHAKDELLIVTKEVNKVINTEINNT